MAARFSKAVLLSAALASAEGTCPEKIFGSNPSLTRAQFCESFQAMGDSVLSLYTITIPKPNAPTDSETWARLRQIALEMFQDHALLDYRDSSRLPPPSQGTIEYDSILMTKATAVALGGEPYVLGLSTFLPSRQYGCPEKIRNGRPYGAGPWSRTDSVSCSLFKSLDDSDYSLYNIQIPRSGPVGDWFNTDKSPRLQTIAESMFTKYDLRDYRDSARLVLPFKGIQSDWSVDYMYRAIMMTKATALKLIQEPYILGLWFDPEMGEVSLRPSIRPKLFAPVNRGRDALGRARKEARGGAFPVFPEKRVR